MKNNVFVLILVSSFCYGLENESDTPLIPNTIAEEKDHSAAKITIGSKENIDILKPEEFSVEQVLSAAGAGYFSGLASKNVVRMARVAAVPAAIFCVIATVAPKFVKSAAKNITHEVTDGAKKAIQYTHSKATQAASFLDKKTTEQQDNNK